MKQLLTTGIVLTRTSYGEADRIITLLTPDYGKLRLMARGVRRLKSKLAGGIELFSVSDITFIKGRGEIGTLISARLDRHYGGIVKDIERVQLGYDLIRRLNKATEDQPEAEYFILLEQAFAALDDENVSPPLTNLWFQSQLIKLGGHSPNLRTDTAGQPLAEGHRYDFDFDAMAFVESPSPAAAMNSDHIKCLRLLLSDNQPQILARVPQLTQLLSELAPLIQTMLNTYIRV